MIFIHEKTIVSLDISKETVKASYSRTISLDISNGVMEQQTTHHWYVRFTKIGPWNKKRVPIDHERNSPRHTCIKHNSPLNPPTLKNHKKTGLIRPVFNTIPQCSIVTRPASV